MSKKRVPLGNPSHHRDKRTLLSNLRVGENGVVKRLGGTDACTIRLMEMGITPGTVVTLNRIAPLGDPLHLTLRGYDLSIRKSEAERIEVARVPQPAASRRR